MQQHELLSVLSDLDVLTALFLFLFQSNSKLKLVRSLAVCEESSSPFVDGLLESQVGPKSDKLDCRRRENPLHAGGDVLHCACTSESQ